MESEKVKEIKKALEYCAKGLCGSTCPRFDKEHINIYCQNELNIDVLTLINELESENKDLQDLCNKTYDDLTKEIDRLEKENAELKVDLKNSIDMQKQMLDGFKTTIKEVEENIAREIPNLLKQFAERLKEESSFYRNGERITDMVTFDTIDETLKEFLKGENNE